MKKVLQLQDLVITQKDMAPSNIAQNMLTGTLSHIQTKIMK